jgi:hypothetical protein
MGKTVESYRLALESEISRWNGIDRALRKVDREAFEEMRNICRNNAMALVMLVRFHVCLGLFLGC